MALGTLNISHALPVLRGRQSGVGLEVAAERGLVGESEVMGNLLNGHLTVMAQHGFGLDDDVTIDPLEGSSARLQLDDSGKVLGREVEQVGIETHLAALTVMLFDGVVERGEEFFARRWAVCLNAVLAPIFLQLQEEHFEQVAQYD